MVRRPTGARSTRVFLGVLRDASPPSIHGHAHGGTEKGFTPGGIQVRNVAQAVINRV